MYLSDYEIRLAVGVVSRVLQNSSFFTPNVPHLWPNFIIVSYCKYF